MKYEIVYWTAGDSLVTRIVDAETQEQLGAKIGELVYDPQEPLTQVKSIAAVESDL